jgi:hypothetical protein
VTFGLGKRDTVDGLSITWPDGSQQQVAVERVDQLLTVQQELVAESSTAGESFEALANRSKAELENGNYETAIGLLRAASTMQPDFVPIRRNLARALVLGGQAAEAIEVLQQLDADATQPLAANAYLLGLASLRQLDNQAAVGHFRRAVELDPNEATLRFQLALALTGLGETAEAQTEFEQAARLDPLHGGAQYQLAVIARRAGEMDAFRNYMRDYQRIRDLNGTLDAAALEGCRYTQAEAVQTAAESMPQTVDVPSQFMVETLPATAELPGIAALAVFDLADTGRYQLVGVTTEGKAVVLDLDESGHPQLVAQSQFSLEELGSDAMVLVAHAIDDQTLTQVPSAEGGDQPEIAVVTPTRTWLLHYGSDGELRDLTDDSGLAAAAGTVARWVDLDHDGDVDLCTVSADGVRGWRNNSDGTFVEATAEFGLEGFGPATDLAAVDLDATNMGVDLVLAGPDGNALARNQFAGTFASEPTTAAAWPAAQRVLADDFNNDGTPDLLFLAATNSTLALGGDESHQTLSLDFDEIAAAATIDVDNDGWLDVALFGGALFGTANAERRAVLIRNAGGQLVANPEPLPAVEPPRRHGLLDLDADGDGHTDLLVIADDGTLSLLHNDTPTDNRQVKLVLRSFVGHPSSAGVRVEVRRENLFASRWTERELPVEIGIGPHDQADSIQTLWTNGIAKNEIDVPIADAPVRVTIIEFVRTSSCPFLYVWADGGWQFVTDLLGTAPLNVAVARGVPMPPDPDEVVVLGPAERFRDHDVAARLRITSELREVTYLNHARLLAVDHPADATVFSRDRAALTAIDGPQFAVGRAPIAANSAVGSDGVDRTAALAAEDGVLAEPGRLLPPPVVGFTKPLTIEFDFGEIDTSKPYLLALTGWFRFGNSSANIAASQRGDLEVVWPRLEVADAQGQWQLVDDAVGFPAGNTKTIVCDLADKLPHGARRMRLTTSFEVRWDRVALVEAVPTSNVLVTELEPTTAELAWHGFADLHAEQFESPHVPNPRQMSDLPRWLTVVEGWCTRYGDIRPLVATADDRMAVLNSGDGATLEFAADRLPQRTPDTSRTLLLYSRGWIKEADPNSLADRGVSPLPDADLAPDGPLDESLEGDWQLQFNTRWVPSNRFQLGPDGT